MTFLINSTRLHSAYQPRFSTMFTPWQVSAHPSSGGLKGSMNVKPDGVMFTSGS